MNAAPVRLEDAGVSIRVEGRLQSVMQLLPLAFSRPGLQFWEMRGVLLRLSTTDAQAEAAVRMIAAFDQLVAQRAEIGGIVRTAAAVAECNAGLWDPIHGLFLHVGPYGREIEDGRHNSARTAATELRA